MAKTPERVHNFLDCQLDNGLCAYLETLAEAKHAVEGPLARRLRCTIFPSTQPGLVREQTHELNLAKAAPYFSVKNIMVGIVALINCLFGVSIKERLLERSEVWTNKDNGNNPVHKPLFFDAPTDKLLESLYHNLLLRDNK